MSPHLLECSDHVFCVYVRYKRLYLYLVTRECCKRLVTLQTAADPAWHYLFIFLSSILIVFFHLIYSNWPFQLLVWPISLNQDPRIFIHTSSLAFLLWPPHFCMNCFTVEPRLMDTPQQRTPTIWRTILKVPTVLPFTSILKQPLNSGHPATPYNGHFSQSQLYASNTQRPRFRWHSSTFSARLFTIAAVVVNLILH